MDEGGGLQISLATRLRLQRVEAGLRGAVWGAVADEVFGFDALADDAPGEEAVVECEWTGPCASDC